MNERERLIELLKKAKEYAANTMLHLNIDEAIDVSYDSLKADYLLENGVAVLPCDYGDTVWFIKSAFSMMTKPIESVVTSIRWVTREHTIAYKATTLYNDIDRGFSSTDIGKTVFLTREAAEQAIQALKGGNE